ncbi:MAG: molecular chaperone TorD family protein [Trueperaceae bacterium]|nr:molecular chaperone TorD family protein [Trueperaceae bacterium]
MTSDLATTVRFCNAARALARVFALPGDDLDERAALCRQAAGDDTDALAVRMRRLADRLASSEREAFARSYARLFLGPFEVRVPPYASWFLETDQGMMGPVAQAAAKAYAAAGLGPADGPRELPDHVAVELEFCYLLGYRGLEEGDGEALAQLDGFWRDQMMPWLPAFAAAVAEHADHPAFAAAAETLRTLIEHGPAKASGLAMEGARHGS